MKKLLVAVAATCVSFLALAHNCPNEMKAIDAKLPSVQLSAETMTKVKDLRAKGEQWRVSRTQAADLWCCTEDGSRPPEAGLQEQASNHPVLLRSKGAVVSDRAKVIPRGVAGVY